MPDPNFSLPSDFPDLTLPEKTQREPEPLKPIFETPAAQPRWRVGDRVLAPWEPDFLYAGKIVQIDDRQVLIQFDDGDAGWVAMERIQPLVVRQGQKVLSRRKMGQRFHWAEIREIRGDQVRLGFDDGLGEEWTSVAALRIPCPAGPGARPTKVASHTAFHKNLAPGDRVWAPWQSNTLFAGTVDEIKDREVHVHFDDGDRGWVLIEQVLPLEIGVGMFVMGRWRMGNHYYPGRVTEVKGERIHVQYDDGDKEWTKAAALAVPCETFGPDARPTRTARRANWTWILILIGVALYFLFRLGGK